MSNISKERQTRGRGKGVGSNWGGMYLDYNDIKKYKDELKDLDAKVMRFTSVNGKILPDTISIKINRRQGKLEDEPT